MKLKDADALIEQIKNPYTEYPVMIKIRKAIEDMINEAPTIDAEPVRHGYWISEKQTKFEKLFSPQRVFKCSVCGNYLDFDGVNAGRGSANFCPNCGATMDEVEDVEKTD